MHGHLISRDILHEAVAVTGIDNPVHDIWGPSIRETTGSMTVQPSNDSPNHSMSPGFNISAISASERDNIKPDTENNQEGVEQTVQPPPLSQSLADAA